MTYCENENTRGWVCGVIVYIYTHQSEGARNRHFMDCQYLNQPHELTNAHFYISPTLIVSS